MTADAARQLSTFRGQQHQKSAPIGFPDFSFNQTTIFKAIENTGQCRSLVGKTVMEIGNFRRRRMREHREDVRLALRQSALAQVIEIKADPVCRAVNWMNKT